MIKSVEDAIYKFIISIEDGSKVLKSISRQQLEIGSIFFIDDEISKYLDCEQFEVTNDNKNYKYVIVSIRLSRSDFIKKVFRYDLIRDKKIDDILNDK